MLVALALAHATSLTEVDRVSVEPGVTLTTYRASSPSTDVYVLRVDLCTDDVYIDATRETASYQSTGGWADEQDLTAATNGDFYKTDPVRVYGDAFGGGVRWPSPNTGWDSAYEDEWYWEHYGWIAFGHDRVDFSHTGWVKENVTGLAHGVDNGDPTPAPPDGVLAMVSGFPELVVEGKVMTCADPEDSDCFPDRSDMRDRHPRTAMGLTEDLSTFLLVVADGRTSSNAGLYGSELADIMGQLGAWEAFNLDGGGSAQLWTDAEGYENDIDGNNNGGGTRTVANHWGVFAGGRSYLPARPGHCATSPPCGSIPAGGGVVDNTDACFRAFGDQAYWRDETEGYDGGLLWTNAFESSRPDNWAWWRLELAEAGDYEVFTHANAEFSVWDDVEYAVMANGADTVVRIDPSGKDGWVSLGTHSFAAGGEQWVALYDDQSDAPGSNQHIVADAIKLERRGDWCGDGLCTTGEACVCADCPPTEELPDNGGDDDCDGAVDEAAGDSGGDSGGDLGGEAPGEAVAFGEGGCGCAGGPAAPGMALLLAVGVARRRGRRSQGR